MDLFPVTKLMNMKQFKYENRYHDQIIFTQVAEDVWHMSGFNPNWARFGWANDYSVAYGAYCMDEDDPMPLEQFEKEVTKYYEPNKSTICEKYGHMVTSDKSRIDMFDPSGGPCMTVGQYWKELGGKIANIEPNVPGLPGVVQLTIQPK
jgi:hypothetical protein